MFCRLMYMDVKIEALYSGDMSGAAAVSQHSDWALGCIIATMGMFKDNVITFRGNVSVGHIMAGVDM